MPKTTYFIPDDGAGCAVCTDCGGLTADPQQYHVRELHCLTVCQRCHDARRLADLTGGEYRPVRRYETTVTAG